MLCFLKDVEMDVNNMEESVNILRWVTNTFTLMVFFYRHMIFAIFTLFMTVPK